MTGAPITKGSILLVDDDESVRNGLFWTLTSDYHVFQADSREQAYAVLSEREIDVVVSDLHLPPHVEDISEGLALIDFARSQDTPPQVVVITGSDSKRAALEAVKRGAYGFFEKPLDTAEIQHIVSQAARMRKLEIENSQLRDELSRPPGFSHLLGTSQALERVLKQARSVAAKTATVLLTGENGTGKEMLARAIHQESPRASGPFVAVSCAALPETLIESELFGHEKGAFTSAMQMHKGRFELADGGTLFLDEIGDLSAAVQVKLLRVLQEREFERVGGTKTLTVDIRLIAATNRDLEKEVAQGRFRQDLFFRLNVVPLVLPPLRERPDDIRILAAHFAAGSAQRYGRSTLELEPALVEVLLDYHWPGNVRELENLIERLVVLSSTATLGLEFVPEKMLRVLPGTAPGDENTLEGAVEAVKRRMIESALKSEGNKVAAAKKLGTSRSYLHRLINEFDL